MQSDKTKSQIIALQRQMEAGKYKNLAALKCKIWKLKHKMQQEIRQENNFKYLAL